LLTLWIVAPGTGGVSITGVQLAKAAGAVTIITSSSDEKLKFVKEKFGVDHVINYRTTPNWADEVRRLTNGEGVDYVIEIGGAGTIEQSIKATAPGGMIAVVGYLADIAQENMPNVPLLALIQGCAIRGVLVGSKQLTSELLQFVSRKNVQPYIHKTFGFEQDEVVAAFDLLNSGSHIGKIGIAVTKQ
jgi:NADPH:quinone reductase-like Zn-dependent oxidoreductase